MKRSISFTPEELWVIYDLLCADSTAITPLGPTPYSLKVQLLIERFAMELPHTPIRK